MNRHAADMILVDTHCHIHDDDFGIPPTEILAHAHANHVNKMITIGTSPDNTLQAQAFCTQHSEVSFTFGYHPHEYQAPATPKSAQTEVEQFVQAHSELFDDQKLVAIGEIGLDYHYEPYDRELQIALLEAMLQVAQDHKLPVSFHVREAFEDFWPIFDNFHLPTSVLHSFSGRPDELEQGLKRGLFVGVNGLSTFATIPHAPLNRIILETDAPYLTPKPFRGTINRPGYIYNIAEWAAQNYQVTLDEVARITTQNAENLFKI